MLEAQPATRYRFGAFELDAATGELRRNGLRVKLHTQPFELLLLLLQQPGEMLTREEISSKLWPDGTFVDYEHGVNSAINRLREALGDKASNPRFVQTIARRGYRFVAPVERIAPTETLAKSSELLPVVTLVSEKSPSDEEPIQPSAGFFESALATQHDLPKTSHAIVQTLFVLMQLMYVSFYVGALANLEEIADLFASLPYPAALSNILIVTATILIPVRIFLLCAALFHAPRFEQKFRKLWWYLLPFDLLWALAPFLLLHHINYGLALAATTLLVYSPFAQRSLVLMGAGTREQNREPAK
jgi:cholera toxin transcriptional activator